MEKTPAEQEIKKGDVLHAVDGSCTFEVREFTRVGIKGILTQPNGEKNEGYATYSQIDCDYKKNFITY